MKNFEFKSQVATSIEQSKRLMELGLKKETADCALQFDCVDIDGEVHYIAYKIGHKCCGIPAWSLHRLMLIANANNTAFYNVENMYESLIKMIASNIKYGYFNKDYLEERK